MSGQKTTRDLRNKMTQTNLQKFLNTVPSRVKRVITGKVSYFRQYLYKTIVTLDDLFQEAIIEYLRFKNRWGNPAGNKSYYSYLSLAIYQRLSRLLNTQKHYLSGPSHYNKDRKSINFSVILPDDEDEAERYSNLLSDPNDDYIAIEKSLDYQRVQKEFERWCESTHSKHTDTLLKYHKIIPNKFGNPYELEELAREKHTTVDKLRKTVWDVRRQLKARRNSNPVISAFIDEYVA